MADPARYDIYPQMISIVQNDAEKSLKPTCSLVTERCAGGNWIKADDFEDYKAGQKRNRAETTALKLGMEVAHLRSELADLRASSFTTAVPSEEYERLKSENERLRKAGDALCEEYSFMLVQDIQPPTTTGIKAWLAAKGVQS